MSKVRDVWVVENKIHKVWMVMYRYVFKNKKDAVKFCYDKQLEAKKSGYVLENIRITKMVMHISDQ